MMLNILDIHYPNESIAFIKKILAAINAEPDSLTFKYYCFKAV